METPKQIKMILDEINRGEMHQRSYPEKSRYLSEMDLKDKTRKILWDIYRAEGYRSFMGIVHHMQSMKGKKYADLIQVKGEIAEVVLEILIHQFIKEKGISDWYVYKGLILGDKSCSVFSTEIDVILATPKVVTIIEVKSYNGNKIITGNCLLTAKFFNHLNQKDVYSQNRLHIEAFWKQFGIAAKSDKGIIKSVLFSYSSGSLSDQRTKENREIMPVYTENDFGGFLNAVYLLKRRPIWDVGKLDHLIRRAQKTSISYSDHIKYVNSLHGD